ncbi:GWxTD domain-containing protein [Lutibacter sp.]|uniref:GWxTD domain-containing protein n=1 Tax=Lutibacter sp. TaxID=1925666 RepID=UPI001A18938F|nr:GWxTD domain-containing protein [Lutibacter sp.]MBI9042823.1 GWxTD domain-containing protein [Lutibacter sp.]
MKFIKLLAFLVFTLAITVNAQNDFDFEFDYARFNYDSSTVYLEIYYSFNQGSLTKIERDGQHLVEAELSVNLVNKLSGISELDKKWSVPNVVADPTADLSGQNLIGVIGFYVPGGEYELKIAGLDKNNLEAKKEIIENVEVIPFPQNSLAISDIELSTNIKKDGTDPNSIFYKNTLEVVPNPEMLYSENMPVLFYYTEIYNIKNHTEQPLELHQLLYNSKGQKVDSKIKDLSRKQTSRVELGFVNLKKMPTDTYNLVLALVDSTKKQSYASNKRFFLYNPKIIAEKVEMVENISYLSSEFAAIESEECDDIFNKSKYVASKNEIDQYEILDSAIAKREFLFKFWKHRDVISETPQNEYKKEYFERVAKSNSKYGAFNKKGYKSDRGRVLIIFGEPDQVDRHPSQMDTKPYEIWYYNSMEGGVYFVFADISGFSDYELVHSTKRGEMRDDTWTRRVQQQ